MACGTIQGYTINKNNYYINVVCIHLVPHWGTNQDVVLIEEIWYLHTIIYLLHSLHVVARIFDLAELSMLFLKCDSNHAIFPQILEILQILIDNNE